MNQAVSRWATLPVLLIVWLAPFLGGGTQTWAMATIFLLLALLFMIYPVTRASRMPFTLFLIGLSILPLFAFLPVALTGIPVWRTELTQQFSISFPKTISPQPWLTFDVWLAWLGGLAWIYWLAGQGWKRTIRKPLAEFFAVGMIVLTIVGLVGYYTRHPLPFWHAERLFGPFENRNQTANLLGLTFVLVVALLHMAVQKKSKTAALWGVGLLVLGCGLIVNFSKSGIILPVVGLALYWLLLFATEPSRGKLWVGLASLVLIVGLLLGFGGQTLDRFTSAALPGDSLTSDYRLRIFADTWNMTRQHPIFGVGLGNFAPVFPIFRNLANGTSGIIHPESDWLWLAAELGWPAALAIVGATFWLVYRAFYVAFKKPHPLRLASTICGALFVLHGFYDISGHRFGTFFPACFLFSLCWSGQATARPISLWYSRSIALLLAVIAFAWFSNLGQPSLWPGLAPLANARETSGKAITQGRAREAFEHADAALRWAPLDWELYYQRGTSRILLRRDWAASYLDYQRANRLERYSPIAPENEGLSWLSYRPELAALPWSETLRRLPIEDRDRMYARFLETATPYPSLSAQLEMLGGNNIAQSIIQLSNVPDRRFPGMLAALLEKHPNPDKFTPKDQRALLDIWSGRGNPQSLIDTVKRLPGLLPAGTIPYAGAYARLGDFEAACTLVLQFLAAPKLPDVVSRGSDAELDQQFRSQNNLAAGLTLFKKQLDQKDLPAALHTLERLERVPDAPLYLLYFNAKIHADLHEWPQAWEALTFYIWKNRL